MALFGRSSLIHNLSVGRGSNRSLMTGFNLERALLDGSCVFVGHMAVLFLFTGQSRTSSEDVTGTSINPLLQGSWRIDSPMLS
jgi:hypothetical protein